MTIIQQTLSFNTEPRKAHEITNDVKGLVLGNGIEKGLCHLFIQHTSASLMLCENADPGVGVEETFMIKYRAGWRPYVLSHDRRCRRYACAYKNLDYQCQSDYSNYSIALRTWHMARDIFMGTSNPLSWS